MTLQNATEIEAAKQSVRASMWLALGNLVATGINTLTALIIARLLEPYLYGLYTLVLVIPTIFVYLAGWGLITSITRSSAYHLSRNERDLAIRKTRNSIIFLCLLGCLFTSISYFVAPYIAVSILHRVAAVQYVQLSSLAILGQIMLQSAVACFVGWRVSSQASLSTIIQAGAKAVVSISLIFLGFALFGAIMGQVVSMLAAGGVGVLIFSLTKLPHGNAKNTLATFIEDIRSAIRFGFPSEFSLNLSTFISTTYIIIVLSAIAANDVVGWYQAAFNLTIAITFLSQALTTALFPAFSHLEGMLGDTKLAFTYAVKHTSYIIAPIILFLAASSGPLIRIVYGPSYLPASPFLVILSISFLPILIGLSIFAPFFNGVGKTRLTMITALSSVPPIILLAPVLGEYTGPYGLVFSVIISDVVTCIVGLFLASRYLSAKIDYYSSLRVLSVGLVCFSIIYFMISPIKISVDILFLLEAIVFIIVYFTLAPLARAIEIPDIDRLRTATSSLGAVSQILALFLVYEERLAKISKRFG